ncbi:Rad51-domain-containing protein [Atractiella rhizophila]|nr:Rad51-domain-containing protein [Atractiella rhizophila]
MAEIEQFFIDIDALQEAGISAQDIAKLKAAGIATIVGVLQVTRKSLCKIKGLSEIKVDKIKDAASKILPTAFSFSTGVEVATRREKVVMITTGSKQLDAMLGGGVSTQSVTEGTCSCFK